ncbi:hypothetical protein TW86_14235 [Halomonas sp. S2151]|uniref:hypothetical protein n=1 Tax=Halomonas sp. S2151 TaxID=579478 RepID=UPI0005FA3B91|nr:hypothetical protein [Halomonas sp. S2151]KJZ10448.1 hypothetical protein TW86_14235 [Halomonas sp. S2151]MBR9770033.1 hypothetical protein [Gammaproteobacteria bacterium]
MNKYLVESYLTPKRRKVRWAVVKLSRHYNEESRMIVSRHSREEEARAEAAALSFDLQPAT